MISHIWHNKFKVECPNGKVFDHSRRKRPYRPKPLVFNCIDCWKFDYWDSSKGISTRPVRCRQCNARHGSASHARKKLLQNAVKICLTEQCKGCGKDYDAMPQRSTGGLGDYCTVDCVRKYANRGRGEDRIPQGIYKSYWPYVPIDCYVCGAFTLKAQPSPGGTRCCSDECRRKMLRRNSGQHSHRARARKTGAKYESGITIRKLSLRDGMRCKLCGCRVHEYKWPSNEYQPRSWSIGHIVAMSNGGDHTWSNIQLECVECNSNKGAKDFGQLHLGI